MKAKPRMRNTTLALVFAGVAVGMVGASFAAVPLYRLFCQLTGYAGTPRIAAAAPSPVSAPASASTSTTEARTMTVRFNADVNHDLPWRFRPAQTQLTLPLGETVLASYVAENLSREPITGTATFNVTPFKAASYFIKVECFCFTEQTLGPGQRAEMPVSFFIDPEIAEDPDTAEIKTVTLSYTFFRVPEEAPR